MADDELPLTRAPDVPKVTKSPFIKQRPTLSSLIANVAPEPIDTLSETVEVKNRDKPEKISAEHVERLISEMDDNKNGFVEREEFRSFVRRKGWPVSDEKADQMFDEADSNGDGRLDFNELQAAASIKLSKRVQKNEWFTFLSQVAEQLSEHVFEQPSGPAQPLPTDSAMSSAPNVLSFRPTRFGESSTVAAVDATAEVVDTKARPAKGRMFVAPAKQAGAAPTGRLSGGDAP
jgi:hypothetical protein